MGRLHLFVGLFAVFFWGSVTNFIQSPKYYAGLSVEYDAGRVEMLWIFKMLIETPRAIWEYRKDYYSTKKIRATIKRQGVVAGFYHHECSAARCGE